MIAGNDILPYFKTYRLGPHTAYNAILRRNIIEQIIINEVRQGDLIMFCFGEIDCRAHLIKQSELQNKPLKAVVTECVDRYFKIFEVAKQYGFPLMAWNVPPSSLEDIEYGEYSTYGSCKQRNEVTQLFNELLKRRCDEYGVIFLSIFDKLLDKDRLTNTYYLLDSIHLSQKVMPLILEEMERKGIPLWSGSGHGKVNAPLTDSVDRHGDSGVVKTGTYALGFQNVKSEKGSIKPEWLREVAHTFQIDTFIETGTFLGDTSFAASKIFQSVHTIELSTDLYQKAIERFKNETNIHVYNGDSGKIFPELLRKINGKALFWLDGHYSEGGTAKGDENTPIIKEIKAIKESQITDAVILIDDLRFFDAVWDVVPDNSSARGYPSVVSLCSAIREIDKAYKFAVVGDIFIAYPASTTFDVTPVVASCTISRLYDGTNYNLEQVMEAEAVIGKAQSDELFALQKLFAACVSVESFGLGKHYRLWHALILAFHEDYMKACKEFLMAMNLGFDHWRINWYLAKAAHMAGHYTLANQQLAAVLMAAPDYAEAQQLLKQIEASKKGGNEENKFSSQDRIELAQHYQNAAKYDKAITELEAGVLCDPDNPDICYGYAKLYVATKQYEQAIREFQKVLNLNSTYAPAHYGLGEIYNIMGDSEKALEHFQQAVSIDNKHYNALANILNILIKAGNFEAAANVIKPLLEKSPNDVNLMKIAEQLAAIAKKGNRMPTGAASSKATHQEAPSVELKQQTSKYYQDIRKYYQLSSSTGLINKFVHPVWIKQLTTLGKMITAGLPNNFLLHPICLEMFVRVGWNPQQEYELAYIESLNDKLRNNIYSLKESSIGQPPYDCKKLNISVNTLGMLWYYARISELLTDSPSSIIEFGGGFGSLSRIFKTLNDNAMTYTIIDLPEMLSLQYYYLSASLGQDAVAAHISPEEKAVPGKINLFPVYGIENLNIPSDLFISTFALSETPEITQKLICTNKNFYNAPCIYITGQLIGERKELSWQTPNTIVMSALHLRKHTAMNRFHIGNNYELMASQKTMGMKSNMITERQMALNDGQQKDQNKPSYAKDGCLSPTATAVVFSKDRAMQLDCTLRSFIQHCKDIDTIAVKVLYTTSNASHENQYRKIIANHPSFEFIREIDFKRDLISLLASHEYILFLVDDNIFVNDFYVDHVIKGLNQVPDAVGFSLRLGKNTTYFYMLDKPQALPKFNSFAKGVLCYDWTTAEYDFGYPLEVSSSIYRLIDILPLLTQGDYKNPNTLELLMDSNKAIYINKKGKLLCFENSVAFCNPLNMVQTMWINRAGNKNIYTPEKLSQMFAEGLRIDTEVLSGFTPHSCHQEIEFRFIRRSHRIAQVVESAPLVSIMIISYNGIDKIKACIESIKRNTPESHEIVVVDNAKNDGSLDYVKTVPGTVVIANPTNIGYSPARAQAMSLVKGQYIVSLDDDTIVTKGWVSKFIKHAENHPEVGIIGPRSNFVSGPQIVQNVSYNNTEGLETFAEAWSSQNHGHVTQAIRLVGFCMFISRKVIDKIGCIDPNFGRLFGFDDDDYSLRAQIAGFKLMIADDILIHHTGGPQGRGDKVYNKLMLGAWEMFKEKWNLKRDLPYGSPYNITEVLSQKFDKRIHYSPLYERSILEKLLICQADTVKEIPSLLHPEFIEGMTSIIILTQNRLDQTKKCVKSIRKHTPEPHEIIFVDNGSTDGTVKWLQGQVKANKNCCLIENKENVGLAKGRNQGINMSQGEFILLLDNDVVGSEGWLSGMLGCLNRAPAAGIVGPMTNNNSGLQQVTDDSYRSVDYLDKYAANYKEQYHQRRIPYQNIAGFCMLFKRALTEKIGLLDERFGTGHFEDEDFCLRASLEDYRNYIVGDVFIHHHGGKGSPGDRIILEEKWTLNITSPEGKKLAVLKSTELADELYQKGKIDQAAEALINCIKFTPEAKEIYYELARIFIESKRFAEALEVVESMPEAAREELKGLEYAGYAKEGLGVDDEAAGYAERMLSPTPILPREGGGSIEGTSVGKYPPALNLKGVLAYKAGEKEKAADYFRKAIAADPGYSEAYTNLGVLQWTAEKKDEALDYLKKGFVLSPAVSDHSTLYHSAVTSLGQYSDAEDVFREARRLYPNHKNCAFLYIDALIQQGKFNVAMTEIEDALAVFGLDEGILAAALSVREKLGPLAPGEKGSKKAMLSVCMIVKNEEEHLVKCLKSVRDVVDEMIVVDTGSTDKTIDIARVFGAQVFDFEWNDDFSSARNLSLSKATGDWILVLDADEVISTIDHKRLLKTIDRGKQRPVAFDIVTRNYLGKSGSAGWSENDGSYPQEEKGIGWYGSNKVRLFRNSSLVRFENHVHELLEASLKRAGIPIERCTIPIHHYGRLDHDKLLAKGRDYYLLGRKKLEEWGGGDSTALRELAAQARELGMFDEAIDLWQQALALRPDDVEALFNLAYNYIQTGKYQEALHAAKRAVELSPGTKEAVLNYALSEMLMGNVPKTTALLEEFGSSENENPTLLAVLGASYLVSGYTDKGLAILKKLARRRFNNVPYYVNSLVAQLIASGQLEYANLLIDAALSGNIADRETLRLRDDALPHSRSSG
jgi:GT2 family glycosyltransferase/cytochrome c-type biogenesis protein CcmH/NrfG